jgi:CubicO group peptidase (beta-lactamase class C family)
MRKILIIGLLSALFVANSIAQEFNRAKLDSLFTALETHNKFMGSISVSRNDQIVYSRTVGYADAEQNIKSTSETKYRIGTITKMFTAALILKAVEEKKLSLTQTIDVFFPELENANKITVTTLLNHRSGIHNFTAVSDYLSWNTKPKTEKELLDIIIKGKSDFEPDTKTQYSNSNYLLLTFILEKIYKKPYEVLLNTRIIKPLKLRHTKLGGPINAKSNECYSYKYNGEWIKEAETDMTIPRGAGAIISTPSDLTLFIESLFAGKIITEASLKQMTTLQNNIGLGIFQFPFDDKKCMGHGGGIDGFSSMLVYIPEDKVSMAITTNGLNYNSNSIVITALKSVYGKPFEIPSFTSIKLNETDLVPLLGTYVSAQMPLKITITNNGSTLMAQATGQSSFPLEATTINHFKSDMANLTMEFDPLTQSMILKQGGGIFKFVKE